MLQFFRIIHLIGRKVKFFEAVFSFAFEIEVGFGKTQQNVFERNMNIGENA
jgi:hypothetical protein